MTTAQIHTFLTVCRCLSFTEAAASLSLTQSAVSRQISGMENELGLKLFDRNNNMLRLTAAGARVRDGFAEITRSLESVAEEARRIDRGFQGVLRIGQLADNSISRVMGDAIHILTKDSAVNITVSRTDINGLYRGLKDGELDVADTILQTGTRVIGYETMEYQRSQPLYLAVRRELMAEMPARMTERGLVELSRRVPLCLPAPGESRQFQPRPLAEEDLPGASFVYRDFDSTALMTAAGLCAAIISSDNIMAREPGISLIELPFPSILSRCLIWQKENRNPMVPALLAAVKGVLGRQE